MKLRKYYGYLILIFLLAFCLRAGLIVFFEVKETGYHARNINEIEFYYDDVARSLIVGKGFVHSVNPRSSSSPYHFEPGTPFSFVPPLYAWWLYVIYWIFGPNVYLAKIFQSLMDASTCVMLFYLGRKVFNKDSISLVASSLYAVYPLSIVMCSRLYYQIPMNVILCWMVLSFMSPVNFRSGIWTGISVALSALAKPVTLPLIAIMPAIRIIESFIKKIELRKALIWSIAFVLFALIALTPWTIRNYLVFNKFVPVQQGGPEAFYQGSLEDYIDLDVTTLREKYGRYGIPRDQLSKAALDNHLNHLKERPFDYIRFMGKKFLLLWYNTEGKIKNFPALMIQFPFLFAAIIGLFCNVRLWIRDKNWYVPATILFICSIQVVIFPLVRYTLAVMPLVMLVSASGLQIISLTFIQKKGNKLQTDNREGRMPGF